MRLKKRFCYSFIFNYFEISLHILKTDIQSFSAYNEPEEIDEMTDDLNIEEQPEQESSKVKL